jgi:hypothetical protein
MLSCISQSASGVTAAETVVAAGAGVTEVCVRAAVGAAAGVVAGVVAGVAAGVVAAGVAAGVDR